IGALYTSGTSTAVASSRLGVRRSNCTRSLEVEPSGPHWKRKKKRSPPENKSSVGGSESLRLPPVTGTHAELHSPRLGSASGSGSLDEHAVASASARGPAPPSPRTALWTMN